MTNKAGQGKVRNPKTDKRTMKRLYLTQEQYQTLFNAAWHKRKFSPEILDGNQLIAEYCVDHANEDLTGELEK